MSWPTFPIPKSSLVADVIQTASGGKPVTRHDTIIETINGHPLNQFLQLVVPVKVPRTRHNKDAIDNAKIELSTRLPLISLILSASLPPTANESLSFFKLTNIPLYLLYHKIFIESYSKKGTIYCSSVNCDIVTDDCLAIIPSGQLILSLTTKSYQRLGIEGKPSALRKKNVIDKKTVEIDLKSDLSSKFDSNYYKRMFKCMKSSKLVFDILIRWQPDSIQNRDISSESLGNYFKFMKSHPEMGNESVDGGSITEEEASKISIRPCLPSIRSFKSDRQVIPSTVMDFTSGDFNASGDECLKPTKHDMEILVNDTLDFTGASLCSIKTSMSRDSFHLSTFGFDPRFNKYEASQILCSEACGLIPVEFIEEMLKEVQDNGLPEEIPFIALIVNGFDDSVTSYIGKRNEKGKDVSGENMYGLLLTSHDDCSAQEAVDKNDESGERSEKRIKIEINSNRKPMKCLLWRISDSYDYSIEKL